MPLTLKELSEREELLRQEIAERERLLAAYRLVRADCKRSVAASDGVARDEPGPAADPEVRPEPAALPVVSPATIASVPEVNLAALSKGYGGGIRVVTWAIRQMTGNFTVRQIAAVLRQAGCPMRVAKVSVVLNRMKDERKIEELTRGRGRTPSVFFATPRVAALPLELAARHRRTRRAVLYRVFR